MTKKKTTPRTTVRKVRLVREPKSGAAARLTARSPKSTKRVTTVPTALTLAVALGEIQQHVADFVLAEKQAAFVARARKQRTLAEHHDTNAERFARLTDESVRSAARNLIGLVRRAFESGDPTRMLAASKHYEQKLARAEWLAICRMYAPGLENRRFIEKHELHAELAGTMEVYWRHAATLLTGLLAAVDQRAEELKFNDVLKAYAEFSQPTPRGRSQKTPEGTVEGFAARLAVLCGAFDYRTQHAAYLAFFGVTRRATAAKKRASAAKKAAE